MRRLSIVSLLSVGAFTVAFALQSSTPSTTTDLVLPSDMDVAPATVSIADIDGMEDIAEAPMEEKVAPSEYGTGESEDPFLVEVEQRSLYSASEVVPEENEESVLHVASDLPSGVVIAGVVFEDGVKGGAVTIAYRSEADGMWSGWTDVELEDAVAETMTQSTNPIYLEDASKIEAVVKAAPGTDTDVQALGNVHMAVVYTETQENELGSDSSLKKVDFKEQSDARAVNTVLRGASYNTGMQGLNILSRGEYGLPRSSDWTLEAIKPQGVVIHHTASANGYSKAGAAAVVKGIWNFHANVNDWGDVGYHFLVDRYGTVYEGREGSLTGFYEGGHAYGANTNTLGISVVGNFVYEEPPYAAQNSVAKVAAWLFKRIGIEDPYKGIWVQGQPAGGRWIPALSGHRDVGGTECPGQAFYDKLPRLRKVVASLVKGNNAWIDGAGNVQERPRAVSAEGGRLSGADRDSTAIAISQARFPSGATTAYLVNRLSPVDALAAGVVKDGPILFASRGGVKPETVNEIRRLGVSKIVMVGGTGVLPDSLWNSLPGVSRVRLGGADRFDTARRVASYVFPTTSAAVYVADGLGVNGVGSADALVAANAEDGPILLAKPGVGLDSASASLASKLGGKKYQLGSVSLAAGATSLGGTDRYSTSVASARHSYPTKPSIVYLVRGDVFMDGVASGTLTDGPRLLTETASLPSSVCDYLKDVKPKKVVALGGTGAVSDEVLMKARMCAAR